jgi:hypothetical protein
MSLTIIKSLGNLLSGGGSAAILPYVTSKTIPGVTYSATTEQPTSSTSSTLFSVKATCAVDPKGNCVFLNQNVPYVVSSINGIRTIMPYNKTSGFTGGFTYASLDDAMQSLKQLGFETHPPNTLLPPSTTDLATTSAPSPPPLPAQKHHSFNLGKGVVTSQ